MLQSETQRALDEQAAKRMFHPLRVAEVIEETARRQVDRLRDSRSTAPGLPLPRRTIFDARSPLGGRHASPLLFAGELAAVRPGAQGDGQTRQRRPRLQLAQRRGPRRRHALRAPPRRPLRAHRYRRAPRALCRRQRHHARHFARQDGARHRLARCIVLLYANRDERSIIFRAELDAARERRHPAAHRAHRIISTTRRGFVTENDVRALAERGGARGVFYICGPGPFMDTVERGLLGGRRGFDAYPHRTVHFVARSRGPSRAPRRRPPRPRARFPPRSRSSCAGRSTPSPTRRVRRS